MAWWFLSPRMRRGIVSPKNLTLFRDAWWLLSWRAGLRNCPKIWCGNAWVPPLSDDPGSASISTTTHCLGIDYRHVKSEKCRELEGLLKLKVTSLAATMIRWCEGGVNQGLLPMTSEEESNLFCAFHLLNLRGPVSPPDGTRWSWSRAETIMLVYDQLRNEIDQLMRMCSQR
jgi:hypothetical protein